MRPDGSRRLYSLRPEPFRELERLGLENQLAGAAAVSKTARMEFDRVRLFLENSTEFLTPSVSK